MAKQPNQARDAETADTPPVAAMTANEKLKAEIRAKIAAGPEPTPREPTPDEAAADREKRYLERRAEVSAIKAMGAKCVHAHKDGMKFQPDGLADFLCIQGWNLAESTKAFEHFAEHGWFSVPGHLWGEKTT